MIKFLFQKSEAKSEFLKTLKAPKPNRARWTTKDGQSMLVSEMTDSHLQNAHAMLAKQVLSWATLDAELTKRNLPPKQPKPFEKKIVKIAKKNPKSHDWIDDDALLNFDQSDFH